MRLEKANPDLGKGWYLGPWNAQLTLSVGYANTGVDEPHYHRRMTEIYLVARGTAELRVEQRTLALEAGDVVVVEPGEAHTFLSSSPDYFHFVLHTPALQGDEAQVDKVAVSRVDLGLPDENGRVKTAVERAQEFGVDITLLESALRMTPTERARRAQAALASVIALQSEARKGRARVRQRGEQ